MTFLLAAVASPAQESGFGQRSYDAQLGDVDTGEGRPAAPVPAPHRLIAFLGDSLTRGPGLRLPQTYPLLIVKRIRAEELPYDVANEGVSGETSLMGLARLDKVLAKNPLVLVVNFGTNDANRLLQKGHDRSRESEPAVKNLEANIDRIVSGALHHRCAVVLVGTRLQPWYGQTLVRGFAAAFKSVADRRHVPLVPGLLDGVWGKGALWLPNGHPNAAGHEVMAETVWKGLAPVLRNLARAGVR